jgi:hypothetical protein
VDDQALLLSDPSAELPNHISGWLRPERLLERDRLLQHPVVAWWGWAAEPNHARLSPIAAARLTAIRHQLDYWWSRLTADRRAYITEHQNAVLDRRYRRAILSASYNPVGIPENIDVATLVADIKQGEPFQLPTVIRAYLKIEG